MEKPFKYRKKKPKQGDLRRPMGLSKATEDTAISRFFKVVDDKHFIELLAASDDEKFYLLSVALSQGYNKNGVGAAGKHWGPLRLCKDFGINLRQLEEFYRNAMLHIATINMMTKVPDIVESVANESLPGVDVCPKCDGEKMVARAAGGSRRQCPKCEGTGKVVTPGSNDARKLLYGHLGIEKKGSPLLAQQFNLGSGVADIRDVINVRESLLVEGD